MLISLICSEGLSSQERNDSLLVMFWNLENFFDNRDGGEGTSDNEFSSYGSRRWTKRRFLSKCNGTAKSIFSISDRYGRLPDFIGLAEIENANVLHRLLKDTALKKTDYAFIHYEGRDRRGIDVAALYRKSVMKPISISRAIPVLNGDTLQTRDILHIKMQIQGCSDTFDFIVNHHPSKFGGEKESRERRAAAMFAMKEICDSLSEGIIAMGDFNDSPDSDTFLILDGMMLNKSLDLFSKGYGTIRYEGRWDMIDMFLVSKDMAAITEMKIEYIPFLMVEDRRHGGWKPFRTYSGPRYLGGISDHCPVLLWILP